MSQRKGKRKKRRNRSLFTLRKNSVAARDPKGRVHLLVRQDPATGATAVSLQAPLFHESWQNQVTESAASTAHAALRNGVVESRVVSLGRHAMDATSQLADGFLTRAANGVVACRSGCDHCCYQSVGVTPVEALVIVDHLRRTLTEDELAQFTEQVTQARERTRGLSSDERYSPEHPCPFLVSHQCSIYEVRPLSCRGMNSLDAEECERNLRDASARSVFLRGGAGSRSFMEPIRAFHAVSAGLQLGLSELFGLDMRPLDLTAAVHALLTGPSSLIDEWLAGHSPLEEARGGDSSDNASIRAVSGTVTSE